MSAPVKLEQLIPAQLKLTAALSDGCVQLVHQRMNMYKNERTETEKLL